MSRSGPWSMAVIAIAIALGCGNGERRSLHLERIAPAINPACGAPSDALNTVVTALGDFPQLAGTVVSVANDPDEHIDIDSFPVDTRVLEISVSGPSGLLRTIGRTEELDFSTLDDGATIHIFMAPPRGFCPVGPMLRARIAPLTAATSAGILIAGGNDEAGATVREVELYVPDSGAFVTIPGIFCNDNVYHPEGDNECDDDGLGLIGATMTTLPDGRVVAVGGRKPAYQIFSPSSQSIAPASFFTGARAHHAAVALPNGNLLLVGGCSEMVASGACDPITALASTYILDVDFGRVTAGPTLSRARIAPVAVVEPDGRVLVAGGTDATGALVDSIERIDPSGTTPNQTVAAIEGTLAQLSTSGVLAALPGQGEPTAAWIVAPGATAASPVTSISTARPGATLTALEDGKVLVFGGAGPAADDVSASLYAPFLEGFIDLSLGVGGGGDLAPERTDHGAARLADGAVLILGGRADDGGARADAWVYRHDLTGAHTSSLQISLGDNAQQVELLSPSDPTLAGWEAAADGRPAHYRIEGRDTSIDTPSVWAFAAGPHFINPRILARVGADAGGVALILGAEDAAHYSYIELRPGGDVRLHRVTPTSVRTICSGTTLSDTAVQIADETPVVEVVVAEDTITVWLDSTTVLECALDLEALTRGMVGIGVLGGSGAALRLDSLAVGR